MFPVIITLHDASQLNAVLAALGPAPVAEGPAPDPKPVRAEKAKPDPQQSRAAEASAPAAPAASTASSFDYKTLQQAVFTLAAKNRAAVTEVAESFGVKTFKDLPPEQWEAAHTAVVDRLSALEAA